MTKFLKFFIIFLSIVSVLYLALYFADLLTTFRDKKIIEEKVCIREHCFLTKIAKTPSELERGLMFQDKLESNKGMIFVFDKEGIYPFWMKNTLISLDIVWVYNNKVVYIAHDAKPCTTDDCPLITPQSQADRVLEVNGGIMDSFDIKEGDEVLFENY